MTRPLGDRTTVRRRENVAELESADGIVVLAMDAPHCTPFRLTGGGMLVWRHLTVDRREARTVVAEVAAESDSDASEIAPSVLLFLAELVDLELVEAHERAD